MPAESSHPHPSALADWQTGLEKELATLADRHLLRRLRRDEGVDFTSNDYLDLNGSGRLAALLAELTVAHIGKTGSTGSRLLRGHDAAFEAAETRFAAYTGQPAALLFQSGYAANLGALQALVGGRDLVFCDRLCHASLLDGVRLSGARRYYYEHDDPDDLAAKLAKYPAPLGGRRWVISETVFSMDGDRPDLHKLCAVAEAYDALLYLDEAHAIGLYGPGGAGRVREAELTDRVAVTVYPCGKAPGLMGAFVCGAPALKELLINRSRSFIFSTAQPPLLAALLDRVIQLLPGPDMEAARRRVFELADTLRKGLQAAGLRTLGDSQIVPVLAGDEERALAWMEACRTAGLDVRAIRPPSVPPGGSRLRITVQAGRTPEEIQRLIDVLAAGA